MKNIKSYYKILMALFLSLSVNLAFGGGKSSDQKSSASLGSYKTLKISASPEYSAKYKMPSKGDPVEMAYEFFELNKERLGLRNPRAELACEGTVTGLSGVGRASFAQVYNGIRVRDAGIRVFFTPEGEIRDLDGTYYYDIDLSTNYSIDSLSAVQMTLKDIGPIPDSEVARVICPAKPIIAHSSYFNFRDEDRLYLVWPVSVYLVTARSANRDSIQLGDTKIPNIEAPTGDSYGYYIDALTGGILQKSKESLTEWYKALRARGYLGPG